MSKNKTDNISLRLSAAILAQVTDLAPALARARPEVDLTGAGLTRSDVLRLALYRGLRAYQKDLDIEPRQTDWTKQEDDK